MSTDIKSMLQTIRDKQFFDVTITLDGPLEFKGVIPFDMTIVDDVATFKVLASTYDEAADKVHRFIGQ